VYVSTTPETAFATAPEPPRENSTPKKIETPWKACEPDPKLAVTGVLRAPGAR
jgi:hypothetical protein